MPSGHVVGRFADVVVDWLANHSGRELVEIGAQLFGERQELGPERLSKALPGRGG
jgi:hypothetical protein